MAILTRGLPSPPDRRRDRRRQRNLWFERRARQMEAAIGISQSFFEHVSVDQLLRESLFTAHAISRKPGGTGLGTKIIKDVVDAHRGQIGVESTEDIGTTFTVLLPVQQSGAPAGR